MNDAEGSVHIQDPSSNTWFMDGKGNINVNAPKNFTINAGENIMMSAGQSITGTAGTDINHNAGMNILSGAGANHTSTAGAMMVQNAAEDYSLMAANIKQKADKKLIKEAGNEMIKYAKGDVKITSTEGGITKNAKKEIKHNTGEQGLFH